MKKDTVIKAITSYLENVGIDTSEDIMSKVWSDLGMDNIDLQTMACEVEDALYNSDGIEAAFVFHSETQVDLLVNSKVEEIVAFLLAQL